MPPKPKAAAAPAKRSTQKPGQHGDGLTIEEEKELVERQLDALKCQLYASQTRADEAEAICRNYRAQLEDLQADLQAEKTKSFNIVADMARQYKISAHSHTQDKQALERTIHAYKDQLSEARRAYESLERAKDAELAQKDAEVLEYKRRMNEMSDEFARLLQRTIEDMTNKVMLTSTRSSGGSNSGGNNNNNTINNNINNNNNNIDMDTVTKAAKAQLQGYNNDWSKINMR